MLKKIINVTEVIGYIERNLTRRLDLQTVADAVCYSKYHLHRVFSETVGMTIHDYAQRRRLTEAAKLLVFSDRPIIEIALVAGYESQQAFTAVFKDLYKKTPNQYRKAEEFYPLQLRYHLNKNAAAASGAADWKNQITFASPADIPQWMELVDLVIDGFPCLDKEQYIEQLTACITAKQALLLRDGELIIGAMILRAESGSIEFLGIHPQYRGRHITKAFLKRAFDELFSDSPLSITTFREGDKADTGHRMELKELGFAEAELLVEFGYPTQRFTLRREELEDSGNA